MGLVGVFDWLFPRAKTMIAEVMLLVQAVVFFGGVLAVRVLPANEPVASRGSGLSGRLHEIREGLVEAMTSPSIMPIIVAMLAVGALYVGSFFTIIPVLIRDVYHGDAGTFSLVNVAFWSGTITANIALMRRRALVHQGWAIAMALLVGAVVLALMSIPAPFWALCALCFTWGLGAGITITMGRTIVQEAAPPSHRGRIMSIYQFGFSGGAPFGALFLGLIVDAIGPYQTARVGPVIMIVVVALLCVGTGLLSIKAQTRSAESH
jgi:predicted MFS family arabinose efflux permease